MNVFVLDACALIAYFAKEDGAENVKNIFEQAANNKLEIVMQMPIVIVHELTDTVFKKAGYLKSKYKISLADSIALAESMTRDAVLITSDHHEFESIEQQENIIIKWFR